MKSRQFLKNLTNRGLLPKLFLVLFIISGCTSSTTPTFKKEKIASAIQEICQNEYKLTVKAKLIGETLWVYLPVKDIFVKADRPRKILEIFKIEKLSNAFENNSLKSEYAIKNIQPDEQSDDYAVNKEVSEKVGRAWRTIRRVIFSMERKDKEEPKFLCLITADIKNGFEIKTVVYYLDLKKVSYGLIAEGEYQHRTIQDTEVNPKIIDDKEGLHVEYRDITMKEFIAAQIQQRIRLKFQKPELDKNADIDKEVLKLIVYTIKTYSFYDFNDVQLNNLLSNYRVTLNRRAVRERVSE